MLARSLFALPCIDVVHCLYHNGRSSHVNHGLHAFSMDAPQKTSLLWGTLSIVAFCVVCVFSPFGVACVINVVPLLYYYKNGSHTIMCQGQVPLSIENMPERMQYHWNAPLAPRFVAEPRGKIFCRVFCETQSVLSGPTLTTLVPSARIGCRRS